MLMIEIYTYVSAKVILFRFVWYTLKYLASDLTDYSIIFVTNRAKTDFIINCFCFLFLFLFLFLLFLFCFVLFLIRVKYHIQIKISVKNRTIGSMTIA